MVLNNEGFKLRKMYKNIQIYATFIFTNANSTLVN